MTQSKTPPKTPMGGPAAPLVAAGLALGAGPAMAQPVSMPPVPTTRILAVGHMTPKFTPQALQSVLVEEVRDTVKLYLQGQIADWYQRKDKPGVVFVLNMSDPKQAHEVLEALPFGRDGLMDFDLIPLGPLGPLGVLMGGAKG
jgi:hypothetical protein